MRVQPNFDALNTTVIQSGLTTQALGQSIHILTETASTNSLGMTLAESGDPHGTVILAEQQTAGKGRLGRSWVSPPRKNIYCSIILRDPCLQKHLTWIPLATGLALSEAIQKTQTITSSLKWPNDILIRNKKLAGILCQSTSRGQSAGGVIVGFGVNVNAGPEDFPADLQTTSTSLFQESGQLCHRNRLLASMFNHLERWYDQLASHNIDTVKSAYSAACSTLGMDVRCTLKESKEIRGHATAIGIDGSLQVIPFDQGAKHPIEIHSADVIHVR